jgi:hypothetical protein
LENIVKEHLQKHAIIEWEHFPDHDKRMETLEFRNAKHELEKVEHLGCFVCGSMESRESHHVFERAYAQGLSIQKVAHFLYHHFDFHGHCQRDFHSEDELLTYLSHFSTLEEALDTLYNQLILCKTHHRGESTGIHSESTPSFFAWLVREEGFEPTFTEEEVKKWNGDHSKEAIDNAKV